MNDDTTTTSTAEQTVVRNVSVPTWTAPNWMNGLIKLALRTPGLQSLPGRSVALVSWTGRRRWISAMPAHFWS